MISEYILCKCATVPGWMEPITSRLVATIQHRESVARGGRQTPKQDKSAFSEADPSGVGWVGGANLAAVVKYVPGSLRPQRMSALALWRQQQEEVS